MKFGAFVAAAIAFLVAANSVNAVEPQVNVNNGASAYVVTITDVDTAAPANVIGKVDWSTIRFFLNGIDFTGAVLSLVGSPYFQIGLPSASTVTFTIPINLQIFAGRVAVCYFPFVGAGTGACGTNQTVLREPACTPEPGCYENGAPIESSFTGVNSWSSSAFPFGVSGPSPQVVTKLEVIGYAPNNPNPNFPVSTWQLEVWSSDTAFANSAQVGDVVTNHPLSITSITPVGNPSLLNYKVELSTGATGVYLNPGNYRIAVNVDGIVFFFRETPTNLQSDILTGNSMIGSYLTYNPQLSYLTGSQYLRVFGH